jgi:GT2 family glycosyltransferase
MTSPEDLSVSVVIPTYNAAAMIEETLTHVCAELRDGDELVLVDDASSDGTVGVVEQFLDAHCAVDWCILVMPANLGPPAARNHGIRAARGEVIMSVDHDDHWTPGHRTSLIRSLDSHDIVSGRADFRLSDAAARHEGSAWWRAEWLEQPQQLCEFGASAIRRECFESIGLLDERFRFGGDDVEWFSRAQVAGLSRHETDAVVLERTIHTSNLSGDPRLRQELLDVVRHHLQRGW